MRHDDTNHVHADREAEARARALTWRRRSSVRTSSWRVGRLIARIGKGSPA